MTFRELIHGKRVVFVGACPNLIGTAYGKVIDGFDVIIRTNGALYFANPAHFDEMREREPGFPFSSREKYTNDYGRRLDVLYVNNQFYRNHNKDLHICSTLGVKWVKSKTRMPKSEWMSDVPADGLGDVINEVNRIVKSPAMGCYIARDILNQRPEELHICGIDFFESKNQVFVHDDYREYVTGYLTPAIRAEGNRINAGKTQDGHNQYHNTRFFYDLWRVGQITMPAPLETLMERIIARGDIHAHS